MEEKEEDRRDGGEKNYLNLFVIIGLRHLGFERSLIVQSILLRRVHDSYYSTIVPLRCAAGGHMAVLAPICRKCEHDTRQSDARVTCISTASAAAPDAAPPSSSVAAAAAAAVFACLG